MAESEAEIRANARILQEHIDAQNAQIEKEADRIYNRIKSESLRNYIASRPPATFGDYLIGLTCIGSFCLFILFLFIPDTIIDIFHSLSYFFQSKSGGSQVTFRDNVSDGVSSSKSDHEKYLDELRKPLNLINEKLVEAHLTGFTKKIKNQTVNSISFVKPFLNKRDSTIINEKSESIEVLPCAEGGGMIESEDLSACPFYNCPHCWEFSIIETSMGCNWRQQMDVECPRCSKKLRDKKSAKKTRHPLPARAGREKLGTSRIFQWTGYPSALVFEPGRIRLPPTEGLIKLPPRILRRHRLRLSPEGLSIGVINLRWIDIGDIIASDNVIEIFVVPIRQDSYTVMRFMKTSCYLEVPAHRKSEIESAIRQFMARWKVPLKGKFTIAK